MKDDVPYRAYDRIHPDLFLELTRQRRARMLARLDLTAGKLPLVRQRLIGAPLGE